MTVTSPVVRLSEDRAGISVYRDAAGQLRSWWNGFDPMQRRALRRLLVEFGYLTSSVRQGRVWLTSRVGVVASILQAVGVAREHCFLDAGSGDGRVVATASALFHTDATGIEIDDELVSLSLTKLAALSDVVDRERCHITHGDYMIADLGGFDCIYNYSDHPPVEFARKCAAEMKPGAVALFYGFPPHLSDARPWRSDDVWELRR